MAVVLRIEDKVIDKSLKTARFREEESRGLVPTAFSPDRSKYTLTELSFGALFESAPDAMLLADAEGRIILVNSRTEQLFGYHRDELIDERVEMLIKNHTGHYSLYSNNLRIQPGVVDLELYGLRKDGSVFPI